MAEFFDPAKIQIHLKQDTLYNLIKRLENNEIDMYTDFQRHAYLWSQVQMSRLIESILIRFPLPAFFFDASNDDKWLIVDGLQRLSAIRHFVIDGKLRLTGLEYLKELDGCFYKDLHRQYTRRIDECPITLFLIMPGTPANVKYDVFKRINTGGLILNGQEIRNVLASPRERRFLQELARDEALLYTLGNFSKRMVDQELVLRFIAFFTTDYQRGPKNLSGFLDSTMEYLRQISDDELNRIKTAFQRSIRLCKQLFDDRAFEKSVNEGNKKKNYSLFEVWTVCLARISDSIAEKLVNKKELVLLKLQEMIINDEDFFGSISTATQKPEDVQIRYDRIQKLIREVIDD
ncbi:hypothetical protein FACS1894106_0570 [Spirochaetia bacterium]|nr:hypothetical protein FACS1894106_0570 [Spirochaetia bacterium]